MKCVNKYPSSGCRHGTSVTGEKCCIRELSCSRQMRADLKRFVFFNICTIVIRARPILRLLWGVLSFKFEGMESGRKFEAAEPPQEPPLGLPQWLLPWRGQGGDYTCLHVPLKIPIIPV